MLSTKRLNERSWDCGRERGISNIKLNNYHTYININNNNTNNNNYKKTNKNTTKYYQHQNNKKRNTKKENHITKYLPQVKRVALSNVRGLQVRLQKYKDITRFFEDTNVDLMIATDIKIASDWVRIPNALAKVTQKNVRAKGGCAVLGDPSFEVAKNMFGVIKKTEHTLVFSCWGMLWISTYMEPSNTLPLEKIKKEMEGITALVDAADILLGDLNMNVTEGKMCKRASWLAVWLKQRGLTCLETEPTFRHHNNSWTTPDQVWIRDISRWKVAEVTNPTFQTDHKAIILEVITPIILRRVNTRVKFQTYKLKDKESKPTKMFVDESKALVCEILPKLQAIERDIKLKRNSENEEYYRHQAAQADKLLTAGIQRASNASIKRAMNNRPIRIESKGIKDIKRTIRQLKKQKQKRASKGLPVNAEMELIEELWKKRHILEEETRTFQMFREETSTMSNSDLLTLLASIRRGKINELGNPLPTDLDNMNKHAHKLETSFKSNFQEQEEVNKKGIGDSAWRGRVEIAKLFTFETVESVIKAVAWQKAPGSNGVEYAHFKAYDGWTKCVAVLFRIVALCGCPENWKTTTTIPLFKKGDPFDVDCYRMIGMLQSQRCLYEKVLTKYFTCVYKNTLNQTGFRHNHSTLIPIIALDRIIKQYNVKKEDFTMAFLDISKAYDTVERKILWAKAKKKGIGTGLVNALMDLFEGNTTQLVVNGAQSHSIFLDRGLTQGSSIAPMLYTLFISDLLEELNANEGPRIGWRQLNNLAFADDIVIVGTPTNVEKLVMKAEKHSRVNGYTFNVIKCKAISNNPMPIEIYQQQVKHVDIFKYLGVWINGNNGRKNCR